MSIAHSFSTSVEESFVDDYYTTFVDFVRHVQGQGFPVNERVMEAAHERATDKATEKANARGYRSVNFAPYVRSGLAKARARYGY